MLAGRSAPAPPLELSRDLEPCRPVCSRKAEPRDPLADSPEVDKPGYLAWKMRKGADVCLGDSSTPTLPYT